MIWQCNHKFDNDRKCATPHLDENQIKQAFISAMNKMISNKKQIIADFELIKNEIFTTSELETERDELENEMNVAAELMQESINENARKAQNQTEYNKRYNGLVERYDNAKARFDEISHKIADKNARKESVELFVKNLKKQTEPITEFDECLWLSMMEYVTVNSKDDIQVTFKNGIEIKA